MSVQELNQHVDQSKLNHILSGGKKNEKKSRRERIR
jgi:hypothetical protein